MRYGLFLLVLVLPGAGGVVSCDNEPTFAAEPASGLRSEWGAHAVEVTDTYQVIPSVGKTVLPPETPPQNSNNNLDVVRHGGRVYLAWRTAPDHYASGEARLYVVSSADERTWRFETRLSASTDLREPRFLSLKGELFLYLARLGSNPLGFEPKGMSYVKLGANGVWTEPRELYEPGFVPWRARVMNGRAYMTAYVGGEHIYQFDGVPLDVHFLTTTNGVDWKGVRPDQPVVLHGGTSETDIAFDADGTLYAVGRNEAGDETGWGSNVCVARASEPTRWSCKNDPKKYDSPLVFAYDGEIYLVGRRNVTEDGNYDLGKRDVSAQRQVIAYQLAYKQSPKRCSLWRIVKAEQRVAYLMDLPSRGDTCFAAVLSGEKPGDLVFYNYSSPIDGPDVSWTQGQLGPTNIYRHVLRFRRR